jgi:hypothetical protein
MPDNRDDAHDDREWSRERVRILQFLEDLREQLNSIELEEDQPWLASDLDPEFLRELREAREDLQTAFDEAVGAILDGNPDRSLFRRAGLRGRQLALKLRGWGTALRNFTAQRGRETLRELLSWANILLGSLATVLPPVEAIKEYKEVLEKSLSSG